MIKEFYKDKILFISGTTGFLGKVLLEKICRSLPMVKRIYLLVRPKSGITIMERVKKEILHS
jgi:fatty acyl-CoA reductase